MLMQNGTVILSKFLELKFFDFSVLKTPGMWRICRDLPSQHGAAVIYGIVFILSQIRPIRFVELFP